MSTIVIRGSEVALLHYYFFLYPGNGLHWGYNLGRFAFCVPGNMDREGIPGLHRTYARLLSRKLRVEGSGTGRPNYDPKGILGLHMLGLPDGDVVYGHMHILWVLHFLNRFKSKDHENKK